jgi:uncharacterized protein (TIGR02594 family)
MAEKMRVTAYKLNVRAEPKLTGTILGTLDKGDVVDLESTSGDNRWHRIISKSGLRGWSSNKFLVSLNTEGLILPNEKFPWMPIAILEMGVKEFPGAADNPEVTKYLKSTTLPRSLASQDETEWCSAFVNWCVEQAGLEGTDSAMARSWQHWGKPIAVPERGCITVFWRLDPDGIYGHVGFFLDESSDEVKILGGNQSDAVNEKWMAKDRLLGYRVPA